MTVRGLLVIAALTLPASASAATLRYALIVGSNTGVDTEHGTLPPLAHAEREASLLHTKLIERCHFDQSPDRTIRLLRPTREEFDAAVDRLVARAEEDRRAYGEVDTLFGFFFTGHGLSQRLLLSDGPLQKENLIELFRRMNADMNIGIFDACYSGSVAELVPKGVVATPNPFTNLPQEFLNMEGSVWLASSGADEISYEDRALGGVFTHFFIRALDEAAADGPAITFDRIWEYAHAKTVAHTAERGRPQNPRKVVDRLSANGPLYFSFPNARSAKLILEDQVRGRFLLTYAGGQLSEVVEKLEPGEKTLAVYPGTARLIVIEEGRAAAIQEVALASGASLRIARLVDPRLRARFGESHEELSMKGLRATLSAKETSALLTLQYDYAIAPRGVLIPQHASLAGVRWDDGAIVVEAAAGAGYRGDRLASWGHRTFSYLGAARAGLAWELGPVRVSALSGARLALVDQKFDDGTRRRSLAAQGELLARALVLAGDQLAFEASSGGGIAFARGAGSDSNYLLAPWLGFGLGIFYRAW